MHQFQIYTDGSCHPNPGVGGWGLILIKDNKVVSEYCGGEEKSTNNRMEILALINALELTKDHPNKTFIIYSDSKIALTTYTEWMHNWARDGIVSDKSNPDLVRRLLELHPQNKHVDVAWVKGHSGNAFNEFTDQLANLARALMSKKILKAGERRKVKTEELVKAGKP